MSLLWYLHTYVGLRWRGEIRGAHVREPCEEFACVLLLMVVAQKRPRVMSAMMLAGWLVGWLG